jgi:hypothetical protein
MIFHATAHLRQQPVRPILLRLQPLVSRAGCTPTPTLIGNTLGAQVHMVQREKEGRGGGTHLRGWRADMVKALPEV